METYVYEKLALPKSIRLIKFLPMVEQQINLELKEVTFAPDKIPAYETLSYVWGPPEPRRPLICNGKQFMVTKELDEALYQLQRMIWLEYDMSDVFWVDQICINQEDNIEKSQQVQLMGSIYENSTCVWVWLGPEDEHSVPVMDLLRYKMPSIDVFELDFDNQLDELIKDPDLPPKDSPVWQSCRELFCRPWFFRTWTIQEYMLPPRAMLFCGKQSAGFTKLTILAIAFFHSRGGTMATATENDDRGLRKALAGINNTTRLIHSDWHNRGDKTKPQLLPALLDSSAREVTDKRDKVYSLLGLAREGALLLHAGLVPNYDLSPPEVFAQTTAALITVNGNLDSLAAVEHDKPPEQSKGPSWAVDWGRKRKSETFVRLHKERFVHYNACQNSRLGSTTRINATALRLQGIMFDAVSRQSINLTEWHASRGTGGENMGPPVVRSILREFVHESSGKYVTGESIETAVALTVVANRTNVSESSQAFVLVADAELETQTLLAYMKVELIQASEGLDISDPYYAGLPEEWKRYCCNLRFFTRNRRFFSTAKGYIGLGPAILQPDDMVVVLDGSTVPFVLRRRPDSNEYWLVGECYLHGIMEGEAILPGIRSAKLEEFTIV